MTENDVDNLIMDIMSRRVLDFSYDIPYLCGYSESGNKIYIDKDCPWFFEGKPIYKLLLIHEDTEKNNVDKGMHYQPAHREALKKEKEACDALGIDWNSYDRYIKEYVKGSERQSLVRIPRDLDITPYVDDKDYPELKKIIENQHG